MVVCAWPWLGRYTFICSTHSALNIITVFYMSLMHAPLGVYRFGKKSGYLFWGICTFVVMLIIPKIHLHVWLLNLSISIVMAHVVAITIWQLHQDYLLLMKFF